MLRGIITASIVSALWITIQILVMHIKPVENRLKAMFLGFAFSLPFVYLTFQWLPGLKTIPLPEVFGVGLFIAYFLHLLLFFLYAECFYHVERSVTLRLLVEILQCSPPGARLETILADYNVRTMVQARLAVLRTNRFIEERNGRWHLKAKGRRAARALQILAWIFQSTSQAERP